MDTLASLRRKTDGATDLKSVVKTMKAVAASNIGQYEMAVSSLGDYYQNIALGIAGYFRSEETDSTQPAKHAVKEKENTLVAIVFGSDQGLVGQFNDSLTTFVIQSLKDLPAPHEIWAVGGRVHALLEDAGFTVSKVFPVPSSVMVITQLVGELLIHTEKGQEEEQTNSFYIFHNQPKHASGYQASSQRLLPLDTTWRIEYEKMPWPTNKTPQVAGSSQATLQALIHEYLFVSLFKACAESLASENASRLAAMQRAEKNIEELLDDLNSTFHRLRQSSIDEELFDVVSGFEALKKE